MPAIYIQGHFAWGDWERIYYVKFCPSGQRQFVTENSNSCCCQFFKKMLIYVAKTRVSFSEGIGFLNTDLDSKLKPIVNPDLGR